MTRLPELVPELTRALVLRQGLDRTHIARLLVQTYRAADAVADKLGLHDLSTSFIHVLLWAAEQTHDEVNLATASYVRAETFFCTGEHEHGRRFLERSASALKPKDPRFWAAYGSLHMRAAVLAAKGGYPRQATAHAVEARTAADHTRDAVYTGTAFGPGSVRVHEATLALESGDPEGALTSASGWEPTLPIPAERTSHFHIDVARSHILLGSDESALAHLERARRRAPEHTGEPSRAGSPG